MQLSRLNTKKRSFLLISLFTLLLISSKEAFSASFDCSLTNLNKIEKTICSDSGLSKMDKSISDDYKIVLSIVKENQIAKVTQRKWLKWRNAVCLKSTDIKSCLNTFYQFSNYRLENLRGYFFYIKEHNESCVENEPVNTHHAINCSSMEAANEIHKSDEKVTEALDHYLYYLMEDYNSKHLILDILVKDLFFNIVNDYGELFSLQDRICDLSGGLSAHPMGSSSSSMWSKLACKDRFIEILKSYSESIKEQMGPG